MPQFRNNKNSLDLFLHLGFFLLSSSVTWPTPIGIWACPPGTDQHRGNEHPTPGRVTQVKMLALGILLRLEAVFVIISTACDSRILVTLESDHGKVAQWTVQSSSASQTNPTGVHAVHKHRHGVASWAELRWKETYIICWMKEESRND